MKTIESLDSLKQHLADVRASGNRIGFVPTMGALHAGHASLLQYAQRDCDIVVCSIFVNPTQFDDPKDLEKYPKTFAEDQDLCQREGVQYLFAPRAQEMYPDSYRFKVVETMLSQTLCGAHRPGHFDGMLTIVLKLLNCVQADFAYFGEKDFQQLMLVRQMCEAFFINTKIIACPTVRESDGLALSSRNKRLSPEQRIKAARLHYHLAHAKSAAAAAQALAIEGFNVDYVVDELGRRLAAIRIGALRLIDNIALTDIVSNNVEALEKGKLL